MCITCVRTYIIMNMYKNKLKNKHDIKNEYKMKSNRIEIMFRHPKHIILLITCINNV